MITTSHLLSHFILHRKYEVGDFILIFEMRFEDWIGKATWYVAKMES